MHWIHLEQAYLFNLTDVGDFLRSLCTILKKITSLLPDFWFFSKCLSEPAPTASLRSWPVFERLTRSHGLKLWGWLGLENIFSTNSSPTNFEAPSTGFPKIEAQIVRCIEIDTHQRLGDKDVPWFRWFLKFRSGEDLAAVSQLVEGTVKDPYNTHWTKHNLQKRPAEIQRVIGGT